MGPGLCSDLDLFLSRLPALGMKTRRPGRGEPGNGSPLSSCGEGPGGLCCGAALPAGAKGRWVNAGSGGWRTGCCSPSRTGRSLAGREVCSDAYSAWEAEDILHHAGEQSCLPASSGLPTGRSHRIWHAEASAALPNKRDPAPGCQEGAGSRHCPACGLQGRREGCLKGNKILGVVDPPHQGIYRLSLTLSEHHFSWFW